MCRSIRTLRGQVEESSEDEVRAAALQFVRKVSGFRVPSRLNETVFNEAVDQVASATRKLLDGIVVRNTRSTV